MTSTKKNTTNIFSMWSSFLSFLTLVEMQAELEATRTIQVPDLIRIKVTSLGDGGVGKSCLIKRYCEVCHFRRRFKLLINLTSYFFAGTFRFEVHRNDRC